MKNNKIAFVVQRYGEEVNGGAELLCRQLAEKMIAIYPNIEVLTTKAIDYTTWANEYPGNLETINGVAVRRFPVAKERSQKEFDNINGLFMAGQLAKEREVEWIEKQGPYAPELVQYIKEHKEDYDLFVFFTYLYYPTVIGIKEVKEKAILVPHAHDEPFLKMEEYQNLFKSPRAFFLNTDEEKEMLQGKFDIDVPIDIGGVGIDLPESIDGSRFKEKYQLDDYIVYVGRIDEGKNCHILFKYFKEFKKRNQGSLKLVLMGKPAMPIPKDNDIVSLGFVSEQDKYDGIKGAKILVLPSEFESLSMVVLEAMSVGTPVLVYGKCPVLKGHCLKSNGALYYNNYFEYEAAVNFLMDNPEKVATMKLNAKKYVDDNYQWDVITGRLDRLMERVMEVD